MNPTAPPAHNLGTGENVKRMAMVLAVALMLAACDEGESVIFPEPPAGPQGPTGPQGPQGPQGPPGARTVIHDTVVVERIVYVERASGSTTTAPLTCNRLDPKNMAHPPQHWFYHPIPFDSLRLLCVTVS
jgi:hypothetical protein